MQIRELDLKELDAAYEVASQLRGELSYKEFEDLIYDMRHMEYKMIGIFEKDSLVAYAGVATQTNLRHKRHLFVFELVTREQSRGEGYGKLMLDYLVDYAKVGMCGSLVLSSECARADAPSFCEKNGFVENGSIFLKTI
jgi:GNAT superfamily N-acetyltransferase